MLIRFKREFFFYWHPTFFEMKLPYDPVCTSIGQVVGLFVIFSLKGKRFTFMFLSEHLLTLVLFLIISDIFKEKRCFNSGPCSLYV